MTFDELYQLDQQYVMQTYSRFPLAIDRGEGSTLYDVEGRKFIDFTSGIGVASVGYGNPKWIAAVEGQAKKLAHISNLFYTQPYIQLAQQLCTRAGMADVFFANGGGEANEGLIKLARKYSFDKYGPGRNTILTLNHSFHGRTVTTLAATGQAVFHQYFFPFTEGFRYCDADLDAVKEQTDNEVCAVMLELVQGEGGVVPLDPDFIHDLAIYCAERDWLLLVDEVQTGVGRTGTLFAYQQYGILPDAVSFAKGIAGGLPMSGVMANEKCRSVLSPGTHATTFGGNPVAASAALAVLDILDEETLRQVREKGAYLRSRIEAMQSPYIQEVRGLGLMLGLAVKEPRTCGEFVNQMLEEGLLTLTAHQNVIRLLPPLTISQAELDEGLAIMGKVLGK